MYSFGQGSFGALGHGNLDGCNTPTIVKSLWGLGVTQVANLPFRNYLLMNINLSDA